MILVFDRRMEEVFEDCAGCAMFGSGFAAYLILDVPGERPDFA